MKSTVHATILYPFKQIKSANTPKTFGAIKIVANTAFLTFNIKCNDKRYNSHNESKNS